MEAERKTTAVGYVRVATTGTGQDRAQVERHKDTIIEYCRNSRITLTHMIIDTGGREGRGRALDLLVMGRASLLVVPCLAHLSRQSDELAQMIAHYFTPPAGVTELITVAERLDTRTPQGRMAVDVLCCIARFESEGAYHA